MPKKRCILLSLLLGLAASAALVHAQTPGEVAVGQALPDARLRGLNGPPRMLSEFFGRPLIINVWASWCGPCRAEMTSLERLAWLDESTAFTVIGISTDDYVDKAQAALQASNATITHFIDTNLQMENMLGASRLPLTVFVGADGHVIRKVYGAREWDGADALAMIGAAFGGQRDAASE